MRMPVGRRPRAVAMSVCAALLLAACGEDKVDSSNAAQSSQSEVPAGVADASALLEKVKQGTSVDPDGTSRPAAKSKSLVLISVGQNNESAAFSIQGDMEACKALGWKCTILDGKSDPTTWAGLYRDAIAQKPDGIIGHGIDCAVIAQPLKEAAKAGIKTVGQQSFDCDEPSVGGEALFSGVPVYPDPDDPSKTMNYRTYAQKFGATKAAAVIDATKGKPNAIVICDDEVLILKYICDGTIAGLKKIPGAEVTRVDTRLADLGPKLESQTSSALLKNPQANAIVAPHGAASLVIASAVQKAGKTGKIFVMGSEGLTSELEAIKAGGVSAVIGAKTDWVGWGAVDTMNSLFTGKPIVSNGIGWLYIDHTNVPADPSKGLPADKFPDFRSAYKKAWGV